MCDRGCRKAATEAGFLLHFHLVAAASSHTVTRVGAFRRLFLKKSPLVSSVYNSTCDTAVHTACFLRNKAGNLSRQRRGSGEFGCISYIIMCLMICYSVRFSR